MVAGDSNIGTTAITNNQDIVLINKNNVDDGSHWRIWSAIDELKANGLSSNSNSNTNDINCTSYSQADNGFVTKQVIEILQQWGEQWAGQACWQGLLNKKTLLHEVEESIVALQLLLDEWLEQRSQNGNNTPVALVDVCCGKGILSMLASYLFSGKTSTHVSSIIMLDKQKDINWNHIIAANENAEEEGRPLITTWGGCNLHEIDKIVEKLEAFDEPVALVGIHLCKSLSPACAGVVNTLGPEKCPFLCLAPCCLPRAVTSLLKSNNGVIPKNKKKKEKEVTYIVPVRKYESVEERQARIEANQRHDGAKRGFSVLPCYLCSEMHPIPQCKLYPADENERYELFRKATPCWKCGEIGHLRKDCKSIQQSAKPRFSSPPMLDLDIASVLGTGVEAKASVGPFETYSDLLATALQRDNVKVLNVGLVNNSAQHDNAANNWNCIRKSIFIVATSS